MSEDLRTLLDDSVSRLLEDRVTRAVLEQGEEGELASALWDELEAQGFVRAHVAAERGGAGGGWSEAFVVLRAAGRAALPLPVAETMLAAALLDAAGLELPSGMATVVFEPLTTVGDGRVGGLARRVPYGRHVDHVVALAGDARAPLVVRVDRRHAETVLGENLAREARDDLRFADAPVAAAAPLPGASRLLEAAGAMVRSAQMAGALEAVLVKAARYVMERKQFGKAIGSFQVIQAGLAVLAGQVAATGAAADVAARSLDRARTDPAFDPTFEAAVAKVRAGVAAEAATSIAHQVHGAIGFTYEHDLHFFTRRLWSWQAEFGAQRDWAARLGRIAIAAGRDGLWPLITSRPTA